ncbi:MAG: hypothetical protein P8X53_13075 [Chromatiales bacterium]
MKQIFIAFPQSGEKNALDRETLPNEDIRCQNVAEPASVATFHSASYRRESRGATGLDWMTADRHCEPQTGITGEQLE